VNSTKIACLLFSIYFATYNCGLY